MQDSIIERILRVSPALALATLAATSTVVVITESAHAADASEIEEISDSSDRSIEMIRRATRRFSDIEVARTEGWNLEITQCMESEEGGMGYHFGRQALLEDHGALDPMTPEALLYVPQRDGTMEFVAIEYILPFADWQGAEAPVFMDQEMVPNEEFGVWTLHLWFRDNPNGRFAGWNPEVSCAWAATER